MVRLFTDSAKFLHILYITLLSVAGAIVAVLLIGTIFALLRPKNAEPLFRLGAGGTRQARVTAVGNDDIRVFSGLGRLRIPLANSSILILSIAFPYSAGDIAFTEELAAKIGDLRNLASGYFSALPEETIQIDEDAAKQEILRRFNSALRLGRIEVLYFSDLMVIDGSP
jgi:flagellar basal body-associated protein FliL